MNKGAYGYKLFFKATCIVLALTFGASIMVTGVMANSDCGMKCCCPSKPMVQHHALQKQIRSSVGCCAGSSQLPCDLASATGLELPEISIAFSASHLPVGAGPAGNISDDLIDRHDFRSRAVDRFGREKFRSPPLFLQNLSFLI